MILLFSKKWAIPGLYIVFCLFSVYFKRTFFTTNQCQKYTWPGREHEPPPTTSWPGLLLSAAKGQRPRNYSSCCCWIFCLIYALSNSTTVVPPIVLNILNYHSNLSLYLSITLFFYLSIYLSSSIYICQSINWPLPLPKFQYIIASDSGAGIAVLLFLKWSIVGLILIYFWSPQTILQTLQ